MLCSAEPQTPDMYHIHYIRMFSHIVLKKLALLIYHPLRQDRERELDEKRKDKDRERGRESFSFSNNRKPCRRKLIFASRCICA